MLLKKALAVLLFVVFLSACAGGSAPTKVTITMKEFGFEPNTINVTAGTPVELTLVNDGAVEHDFVIEVIPVTGVSSSNSGDHHMATEEHSEYDLHTSTAAGETSTLTFTPTEPGTYQIICSVPGHKDAGMIGELIVK
ncbi:MAG: cupredoxin domain-containing protein [Anaerolineae bacterium]|nr:cupredoxin domain-containing protein [Anaerolineae bacterium]